MKKWAVYHLVAVSAADEEQVLGFLQFLAAPLHVVGDVDEDDVLELLVEVLHRVLKVVVVLSLKDWHITYYFVVLLNKFVIIDIFEWISLIKNLFYSRIPRSLLFRIRSQKNYETNSKLSEVKEKGINQTKITKRIKLPSS